MAEEKRKGPDFSKVEGKDPSTWTGDIGNKYKKYLRTTKKDKLTEIQQHDLANLEQCEQAEQNQDGDVKTYNYSNIKWQALTKPLDVSFLIQFPECMVKPSMIDTARYVKISKKSVFTICAEAEKKVKSQNGGKEDGSGEKVGIFRRFVLYVREDNEKALKQNSRMMISPESENEQENVAKKANDESEKNANIVDNAKKEEFVELE